MMEKKKLRQIIPPLPNNSKMTVGMNNHHHDVDSKNHSNHGNDKENLIPGLTKKDSLERSYNHDHNSIRVKPNNSSIVSSPVKDKGTISSSHKPTTKDSINVDIVNSSSPATTKNGDSADNILRAGEALNSLFCLPEIDVDKNHKQLCMDIAHGHLTRDARAWCKALEYARDRYQRTPSIPSSAATNLLRLHKRAMRFFPLPLSNDGNVSMMNEQQKEHILAIWLYYVDILSRHGTDNNNNSNDDDRVSPRHNKTKEARAILYHIQKNRWGEKVAAFYITTAHLELQRQQQSSDDSHKIQKAIRIIQAGIKRRATPIESLHECLQKLQKQHLNQNRKDKNTIFSAHLTKNDDKKSDIQRNKSLENIGKSHLHCNVKKSNSFIPCLPSRNRNLIKKKGSDNNNDSPINFLNNDIKISVSPSTKKAFDKSDTDTILDKNTSKSTTSNFNSKSLLSSKGEEENNYGIIRNDRFSPTLDQNQPTQKDNHKDESLSKNKDDNERKLKINIQETSSSIQIGENNSIRNKNSEMVTSRNKTESTIFKRKLNAVSIEDNNSNIKSDHLRNTSSFSKRRFLPSEHESLPSIATKSTKNSNQYDSNLKLSNTESMSNTHEYDNEKALPSQQKPTPVLTGTIESTETTTKNDEDQNTNDILFPSFRLKRKRLDMISRKRLGGHAVRVVAPNDLIPSSNDELINDEVDNLGDKSHMMQKAEEDVLWPKRTNNNDSMDVESSGSKSAMTKRITRADINYMLNWDPTEARDATKTKSSNQSYHTASTESSWSISKSSLEEQNSSKGETSISNESSSFTKTITSDAESKDTTIRKNADKNSMKNKTKVLLKENEKIRDEEGTHSRSSESNISYESRSNRNGNRSLGDNQYDDVTNGIEDGNMKLDSKANADFLPLILEENILVVNDVSYAKLGVIGKGGSCKVYRALSKNRSVVAIKRVKLAGMDKKGIQGYANEIKLLKRLRNNPFIIQLHDSEVDLARKAIFLVMEVGEVDLNQVLQQQTLQHTEKHGKKGSILNMNFIRLTWQQMLSAVHSIHQERIIHGDLKPANFLFVRGVLKLIDFGIAKAIQSDDTTNIYRESQIGTLNYMSPESILDTGTGKDSARMKCGRASDVWSLGCILYQMCYGRTPFAELHMFSKLQAIVNPKHKIKFPETVDDYAIDAIKSCLHRNPEDRLPIVGVNGLLNEHCFLHSYRQRESSK